MCLYANQCSSAEAFHQQRSQRFLDLHLKLTALDYLTSIDHQYLPARAESCCDALVSQNFRLLKASANEVGTYKLGPRNVIIGNIETSS